MSPPPLTCTIILNILKITLETIDAIQMLFAKKFSSKDDSSGDEDAAADDRHLDLNIFTKIPALRY